MPPFSPLGNAFAHKYCENAFPVICAWHHLSGHRVTKEEGTRQSSCQGQECHLQGKELWHSQLCWAGAGASAALPSVWRHLTSAPVVSAESWVWCVYHCLIVNSAFQLN